MKSKSRKPVRGILQEWEMIEITDPAERAELDRRCREAEKMLAARERAPRKPKSRKRK